MPSPLIHPLCYNYLIKKVGALTCFRIIPDENNSLPKGIWGMLPKEIFEILRLPDSLNCIAK